MANHRNRFPARRRFLKQSTALTAATVVALPRLAGAAPAPQTDAEDTAAPTRDTPLGAGSQPGTLSPARGARAAGRTRGSKP